MVRYTRDGLPIIDPAWMQDELSDRGDPPGPEDGEEGEVPEEVPPDDHLEAEFEDRVSGHVDEDDVDDWSAAPW